MSRGSMDSEYRPKQRVVQPRRTPRRSRQHESVDYSEFELESDTESESIFSEWDRTVVEEPIEVNREVLEALWTPGTLSSHIDQVGQQYRRLSNQFREQQESMA